MPRAWLLLIVCALGCGGAYTEYAPMEMETPGHVPSAEGLAGRPARTEPDRRPCGVDREAGLATAQEETEPS